MPLKRIIIFRFHAYIGVCRKRLKSLKTLNPGIPIYALYGGEETEASSYKQALGKYVEGFYTIRDKDADWKWKNFDLALNDWFRDEGHRIDFDMAHVIEWDLILYQPLEILFSPVSKDEMGLTGLIPLEEIESHWYWTTDEQRKNETNLLFSFARERYGYKDKPYACLGPGCCIPRSFMEKYSQTESTSMGHDELRYPLFAQIYGIPMKSTGLFLDWFSRAERKFFNCNNHRIRSKAIRKELRKSNGRRAFHPYRKPFAPGYLRLILRSGLGRSDIRY